MWHNHWCLIQINIFKYMIWWKNAIPYVGHNCVYSQHIIPKNIICEIYLYSWPNLLLFILKIWYNFFKLGIIYVGHICLYERHVIFRKHPPWGLHVLMSQNLVISSHGEFMGKLIGETLQGGLTNYVAGILFQKHQ